MTNPTLEVFHRNRIQTRKWLSVVLLFGLAAPVVAQVPDGTGTGTKGPADTTVSGDGIYDRMPARPSGIPEFEHAPMPEIQSDPNFVPDLNAPLDPPTISSTEESNDAVGKAEEAAAPGDYVQFRNTNLGPAQRSTVDEPSLGVNGRVIFYTGNWFAGFSDDGGQTFQFINPFDNFPADGNPDQPANSGPFCCDQVVHYVPSHGLMIWYLQYLKSGDTNSDSNVFRIAVANSQADVLNNTWFFWTFDPADFGLPSTGVWFDYPDLSYTDKYLYMTTNVFTIVPTTSGPDNDDTYNTSLIVRFDLDDIADAGGIGWRWWNRSGTTLRPVQNATTRMYVARHQDSNTLRIYHVTDDSNTLNSQDVDYGGYNRRLTPQGGPTDRFNAPGPDGTDFANRGDSRILAGWRSGTSSEIGFMWNADESDGNGDVSASFPFPYVKIVRIRVSDWSVQQERNIYNNSHAWLYPSVNVNDRGHMAGTISAGGGSFHPRSLSWIIDDYNSPAFPDLGDFENHLFASSDDGPNDNEWGDYLTTRKMVPYGNTWVGTGFRMGTGGSDGDTVPEFIWFGRERDMPPATNNIYVDYTNSTGYETGTSANPFDTAEEGETALQPGDDLFISTGTYNEELIFDTQAEVNNFNGTAIIVSGGPNANPEARLKAEEPESGPEADTNTREN